MTIIRLPEALDISVAANLHGQLLAGLKAGEPVELDAGRVTRVDTAGVQLLVAFLRDANEREIPVALKGSGDSWLHAVARLGLESHVMPAMSAG